MIEVCRCCDNRRTVRLPLYNQALSVVTGADAQEILQISHKDYPCPECSSAPVDRLFAVGSFANVEKDRISPIREGVFRNMSRMLADELLARGLVSVEQQESGDAVKFRMTVNVVHPRSAAVQTMESRLIERQEHLAAAAVSEAISAINNWGSHYGDREIEKSRAIDCLREGVNRARADRASWSRVYA